MSGFADLLDALERAPTRVLTADGALAAHALRGRALDIAEALQTRGARVVASRLDNGPDWLALDLALRARGLVHVPLPTFFSPAQTAHALARSGADLLVLVDDGLPPADTHALLPGLRARALQAAATVLPARTACITFTSGTTGQPKGVCIADDALLTVAGALVEASRPLAPVRHLCLMPLSTLLENISGLYGALLSGADIAVPPLAEIGYSGAAGLDVPRLLSCLHRYAPHSVIVFPQLLLALVSAAEQGVPLPASLRFVAVGGGRVGAALLARAAAIGLPVFEGYGLSECVSVVALNRPGAVRPGSVGRPLPHARVSVVDGELHVDGVRCLSYLGEDAPPPGAIATGDLGHVDDDGFVHVTGRRKHMFITAFGRNVSPEWVESELLQHPLFAQAIVLGEARPTNVAVAWLRRDADAAAMQRALDAVNAGLPDYARVDRVIRATRPFSAEDGLLTANGRPRRDAIAHTYADAIARAYGDSVSPASLYPQDLPA
ncbi:AMP-binding protein [Luteimonas terrae]|uniref:Long-chain acyl-CoA synthetase n=1 Tax=Luteimonas terrae TaxID=1530191 RepID=A0A4R5U636_9GAMM|nr:AMP-binding protein [Luteimonas terrae]TDK29528.1 long-chain acyl-CoA synthetase [Luteimonas terrae]